MMQVREVQYLDKELFINTMVQSQGFHYPFADAPKTEQAFDLILPWFDGHPTKRVKS